MPSSSRFAVSTILGCVAAVLFFASLLPAAVILPNLPAGSQYQLLFVTATSRNATSTDIATYNAFVTNEASGITELLPVGVTWHAIASTAAIDANSNAPNPGGVPVYDTRGNVITSDYLYAFHYPTQWIRYNQYGNDVGTPKVWTGSSVSGTRDYHLMGESSVWLGWDYAYSESWLRQGIDSSTANYPLYALSSPITVPNAPVPEPATIIIWSLLGTLAIGLGWRRRGKAA